MRPFEGFRVLDLTHVLAGPFCTYQLGLLGAEVIKVEEPGLGEYMRRRGSDPALKAALMGDHFLCQNANKRSIVIDLSTERGREIARTLAAGADAVIVNYRAGVVERWGLDYASVRAANPRVVYCSMKAFSAKGAWHDRPGWDHTVQAASGIMAVTGSDEKAAPLKAGAPVFDYASGTMAAFAVAAALLQRERTGEGQFIDLSMLDTAMLLMSPLVASYHHTGREPKPHGNNHALAAGSCYETADGERIMLGAIMQRQFEAFCRRIGREDLLADARFKAVIDQDAHREALAAEIAQTMKTRTAAEWEELLAPDIPAVRVRGFGEAMASPALAGGSVMQDVAVPGLEKPFKVPAAAFGFAHDGPQISSPPPRLGEHTRDILAELGYDAETIARFESEGAVVAATANDG